MIQDILSAILTLAPFFGHLIVTVIIAPNIPNWYEKLKKPQWSPCEDVIMAISMFGSAMGGFSSYLIYRDGGGMDGPARIPLILHTVKLLLAWIWRYIFLGAKNLKWTFYGIMLMGVLTAVSCYTFKPINETAFYLMLPSLTWMIFGTYFTYSLWHLNPVKEKTNKL